MARLASAGRPCHGHRVALVHRRRRGHPRRRASDAHYVFENWATKSSTGGLRHPRARWQRDGDEAALDCAACEPSPKFGGGGAAADDASKHRIDCGGAMAARGSRDAAARRCGVARRCGRCCSWSAELAPTAQLSNLVAKFVGKSTCRSRTAEATANPDCSRTLFVPRRPLAPSCSTRRGARSRRRSRRRGAQARGEVAARPEHHAQQVPQKLRDSLRVVLATHPTTRSPR